MAWSYDKTMIPRGRQKIFILGSWQSDVIGADIKWNGMIISLILYSLNI